MFKLIWYNRKHFLSDILRSNEKNQFWLDRKFLESNLAKIFFKNTIFVKEFFSNLILSKYWRRCWYELEDWILESYGSDTARIRCILNWSLKLFCIESGRNSRESCSLKEFGLSLRLGISQVVSNSWEDLSLLRFSCRKQDKGIKRVLG